MNKSELETVLFGTYWLIGCLKTWKKLESKETKKVMETMIKDARKLAVGLEMLLLEL